MNTIEPMVVRSPLGWEPIPGPGPRHWLRIAIPIALVVALVMASFNIMLPYYAIAPGSATNVGGLITVPGPDNHPARGQILLTTISFYQVRPVDALVGWLRPDIDVLPRDQVIPPHTSDKQYQQLNNDYMDESKDTAIEVALKRLGRKVIERGSGARVEQVLPKLPSVGKLKEGDVIVAIDGKPIATVTDAIAALHAHKPGDVAHLDIRPADHSTERKVDVPLAADPDKGNAILGVYLRTSNRHFDYDPPLKITINSGPIGGPSAGLAFTLGVLDTLTPGELTGGRKVAVTGTIDDEGRVGPIGGVLQKETAVKAAGADVFLVPAGDYKAAKAHAGHLKVIKVATLEEALAALRTLGGDVSALGPPPPGTAG